MNVEIGTEAGQFSGKEYINGIFLAVYNNCPIDMGMRFLCSRAFQSWCQGKGSQEMLENLKNSQEISKN
jgi:hypothetical protein